MKYVLWHVAAYKTTYGKDPVWTLYRRNHKGPIPPKKTRKTCVVSERILFVHLCVCVCVCVFSN